MCNSISFTRRIVPLAVAQTLGVFNDNAFKSVVIFIALGLSGDYSTNSFFIALMTIVYVAPFLIFTVPSGFLADKFSKKDVMFWAKFAEIIVMVLGGVFFYYIPLFGIYPVVIILFLMSLQSSAFSPSYNSILPEIFPEIEISRANGILGMLNFIAVITGFAFGIIIKSFVGNSYYICGVVFSMISIIGFAGASKVIRTSAANSDRKWNNNILNEFKSIVKLISSKKIVFISMLGEAYFYALGSAVQTVVILFGRFSLKLKKDLEIGFLQLIMALGMALGCYLGGRLSRNKLEIGLVPFGAFGLIISLILINFTKWPSYTLPFGASGFIIYPMVALDLVIAGIFAGIFVIPLKVCQQEKTDSDERGKILAFANFFTFAAVLLSGIIIYILTGRSGNNTGGDVSNFSKILNYIMLSCSPGVVFVIIAALTLILSIIAIMKHFDFLFRAISVFLTRTVYRVKTLGVANLPKKGACVLVSNHISLIDTFLISSCTSRTINYVIHKDYYKSPILKLFYSFGKFIRYPENSENLYAFYSKINKLLENGEVVCLFPEGKISRNGLVGKIKLDVLKIVGDHEVPVIPVSLGNLWGSIFSYYYGKLQPRFPERIIHHVNIYFGKPLKKIDKFYIRQKLTEAASDAIFFPRKSDKTLHIMFTKLAKRHPFEKSFIDYEDSELSRFSLLLRSIILSKLIRRLKSKSKYVGVLLPNCTSAVATILGTMFADKIPVILNFTVTEEVFDISIKKADLEIILTSKQFIKKANIAKREQMIFLEDIARKVTSGSKIFNLILAAILPSKFLMKVIAPKTYYDTRGTAVVLFSSGSSGIPKGVVLSHHNITSNINCFAGIMKCNKNDKITGNLPFFHSFGINVCFWIPLMAKISIVYIKNPLDAEAIVKAIKKYKLTMLMSTPTFLQTYLRKLSDPSDFKTLRLTVLGAEKVRQNLAEKYKECTGLQVIEGFGCTELSPIVSINIANDVNELGQNDGKAGSIGRAMPGIATKIVDVDTYETLEPGQEGLLFVKGPNIMKGYLGEPFETKKVIVNKWYNTGDIAEMDEAGFITITGRLSRFSKIGGEMISHELIESTISEILGEENRVLAVTGMPDQAKGEKIVVFYEKLTKSPKKIIKEMRERGIANIWIPKAENFVEIETIPLLGTGKLDISKLNKIAMALSS